jgi:hypothetical protein
MRTILVVAVALGLAALGFVVASSGEDRVDALAADRAASVEAKAPGLAVASPSSGDATWSPAPSPEPARPVASEPATTGSGRARARFVAVDAATNERVDPGNRFVVRGLGKLASVEDDGSGVAVVLAHESALPPGGVVVHLAAWGYAPYVGRFSLEPRRDDALREIRVPLERVPSAAWTNVVLALEGAGPVTDDDAIALTVGGPLPEGFPGDPPVLRVPFHPGGPRTREVSSPGPTPPIGTSTTAFEDDRGRRVWVDGLASVREVRREDEGARHVATILRRPCVALVVEVRPPGTRTDITIGGPWRYRDESDPSGRRGFSTTYNAYVRGGADVLRVLRPQGSLGLSVQRARGTISPSSFAFDPSSSSPLAATLTLVPDAR